MPLISTSNPISGFHNQQAGLKAEAKNTHTHTHTSCVGRYMQSVSRYPWGPIFFLECTAAAAQAGEGEKNFTLTAQAGKKIQQRAAQRSRLFGGFVWWMLQYAAAVLGPMDWMEGWMGLLCLLACLLASMLAVHGWMLRQPKPWDLSVFCPTHGVLPLLLSAQRIAA